MTKAAKVFIDTDVIISSLISDKGAASQLVTDPKLWLCTSNLAKQEQKDVCQRLNLNVTKLHQVQQVLKSVSLSGSISEHNREFQEFVTDINDGHIVAGTVNAKAKFLITYNTKHYHQDKLKTAFDIIVMTPGQFLQYQRSS